MPNVVGDAVLAVAVGGFPDGRFRSLLTRVSPLLVLPSLAQVSVGVALVASDGVIPAWFLPLSARVTGPLMALSVLLAIIAQVLRYRRGDLSSAERQQYKWVIFAFAVFAVMLALVQLTFQTGGARSHIAVVTGT